MALHSEKISLLSKTVTKRFHARKSKYNLEGKIALVTGGAGGIGMEVAKQFLKNGLSGLTMADLNIDKGSEGMRQLFGQFGESKIFCPETDVRQHCQLDRAFKETIERFRGLDIVINNAGVMNDINWTNQINTNIVGCVTGTLLGMQYMSKSCSGKGGVIVNMASVMGLIPVTGFPIHSMTQFAVVGFSRSIGGGQHFARTGVKVLSVCPGLTSTKLMRQAPYYALNEKFSREFRDETHAAMYQSPECVARSLLEILDTSGSGSVWVIENGGPPFQVSFNTLSDEPHGEEEEEKVHVNKN